MIVQTLAAMLGTLAFSILFQASARHWLCCSVVGGIGWLVNALLLRLGFAAALASFGATLVLAFAARLFSYRKKAPVTVFLIAGIFPLVPGAGIYYTAYYTFASNMMMAFSKGVETLMLAGAIVLGILLGFSIPQELFRVLLRQVPTVK